MKAAPAIPFFGDAYLADTRHLSLEEHGAYLQLLMIAWRTEGCRLPADDSRLSRMIGVTPGKWSKLKPTVMAFWECSEGSWRQRRLTKERQYVDEKRAKNSASAKAMWEAKHLENIGDGESERINERNAPPPPQGKEEDSVAKATGAAAPQPPSAIDLKAAVFASGVPLLMSTGTKDRNARSMLGRWRKDYGDGAVLDALSAAAVVSPSEAIPYITKVLETRNGQSSAGQSHNPRGQRPSAGLDLIRSAFEEAAERGDQEAGGGDWGSLPALGTG